MKISNALPINCGRTILRAFTDADLSRFQAYRTDPEVARFQDWEMMTDQEAASFIFDSGSADILVPGHWCQIGIAHSLDRCLIGDVGIYVDSEETNAEIGISLDRNYQSQGLGKETVREVINLVFKESKVERINGITDERNVASISLLKSVGMSKIKSVNTVFRGESCIELVFSISRDYFCSQRI